MPKITQSVKEQIIKDLLDNVLTKTEISIKNKVSKSTITNISKGFSDCDSYMFNKERIIKKGANYQIRITTYLKGSVKSKFIKDCLDHSKNESEMANHIFDTYYYLNSVIPNFEKISHNKIKDYISERIKL